MPIASGSTALASEQLMIHNAAGELELAASTELTISGGAVTASQNFHRVDTEADAASDDLDTITKASDMADGYVLILRAENTARTVVVKHNTGNILCVGNGDITLDDSHDYALLVYDGNLSKWMAQMGGQTLDGTVTLAQWANPPRRQGGSATEWSSAGTTDYTPATMRIQVGTASVATEIKTITFPVAFSGTPVVVASTSGPTADVYINNITATAVQIYCGALRNVYWIAIGPA